MMGERWLSIDSLIGEGFWFDVEFSLNEST